MGEPVCINSSNLSFITGGKQLCCTFIKTYTSFCEQVVFGNQGVLQGITRGKCYVEMSTVDEETVQDVADVSLFYLPCLCFCSVFLLHLCHSLTRHGNCLRKCNFCGSETDCREIRFVRREKESGVQKRSTSFNDNKVHLSCAHQCSERSHDILYTCRA